MKFKLLFFASCVCLFSLKSVFATGLTVNPGEFVVDNLKIGQSYDISKISRPFAISYVGAETMDMVINIYPPRSPINGYEVIPDTSWVKIDKEYYSALPGEVVQVTAVLTIPDDEKYMGKKYDVRLAITSRPHFAQAWGTGLAPAVETRILFSIFKERGSAREQARLEETLMKSRNISFAPTELSIENVPLGKTVDVKKVFNKSLKLTNLNDEPMKIKIKCILPKDIGLKIPEYESFDNKDMIKFSDDSVKVKSNQVKEIKFYINIPDKNENHNKKFLVICEASIDNDVLVTQYRARLFITTK